MIFRTPPQKKHRSETDAAYIVDSPVSDRRLVAVDAAEPISSIDPAEHMVCTYQCRQMVKSEFMVALNNAEKQVAEYEEKLDALSSKLCTSEEERRKYQDHVLFLEQEFEASKGREKALQDRLLKEVNDFNQRYHAQVKHCSELEVQLKKEIALRKHAEVAARSAEEKALGLERSLQQMSETADNEKVHLQKELLHMQDESRLSLLRVTADLEKMEIRAKSAEKELEVITKQLKDLKEQLNECLYQKRELEQQLQSHTTPGTVREESALEAQNLVKHLQEELRNYEAEVQEARRLKSSLVDTELLNQRLLEERERRERAENKLSQLEEFQLNAQNQEAELLSWKSLLSVIPDISCCDDIPKKFASLQSKANESIEVVGHINARLQELEVALEAAKLDAQHAESESQLAKRKAEDSAVEVKRLEMLLSSVTERGRLYRDFAAENKQADTQEVDLSLLEKDNIIKELESSLNNQREIIDRQHADLRLMNEKLTMEVKRVKLLEREGDQLRSEIALLESKLGHGDYSMENTKVLRMVNTLAVDNEAKHTIEALRSELQKTQAKLQAVEELKGHSAAGDIISSDIPEKLAQLKGQIATLEKREERYKTVFAEKISVFRRACCLLFGYKIVMDDQQGPNGIPVTRFTLNSVYALSDDEKLEFDYESGNMNILVNEYTSQKDISQQVDVFIKKWNAIPAFTANLTMESFNKRTFS